LEKRKERNTVGKNEVGGRIILQRVFKFEKDKFKWIVVSQDGDNGFAFVNSVINIWFHKMRKGTF